MDNQHPRLSDEEKHQMAEPCPLKSIRAGPNKIPKKKKKVRWADERSQSPAIIAVVIFNVVFLVLGVLSRSGAWAKDGVQQAQGPHVELEVRAAVQKPLTLRRHAIHDLRRAVTRDVPGGNNSAMQTFQVDVPLLGMNGKVVCGGTAGGFRDISTILPGLGEEDCQVTIAVNTFSNSFGRPFVGNYTPPACLADSSTAIMNLTVQSHGRQFDRLAIVYLGDTEVFRTSTEEPNRRGISYTYMKDMSQYMAMWRQPQKVIFDLPNGVTDVLTGVYNTTLTASFFSAPQAATPADSILTISSRQANNDSQPSVFSTPDQIASNIITDFPRNAVKAIFSVSATGQGNEEFWWSNVLESNALTYNASSGQLPGNSPFREVQVLLDGNLAGVQWPFPVIFTGGVSPSFWQPIVGIDAFDLKEGEIDVSPWLPVLCDGQPHNLTVNVVGLSDDGKTATLSPNVTSGWQVTGKLFVWLDDKADSITTGSPPTVSGLEPTIAISQSVTQNATGFNDTLRYTTSVSRNFSVSGSITTSTGSKTVSWTQTLAHTDDAVVSNSGLSQLNVITTTGTDTSTHGNGGDDDSASFTVRYSYPLNANVTSQVLGNGTTRLDATLERTKSVDRTNPGGGVAPSGLQLFAVLPATADRAASFAGTTFTTTQKGASTVFAAPEGQNGSFQTGTQAQTMRFGGVDGGGGGGEGDGDGGEGVELYFRDVSVKSDGTVLGDTERLAGEDVVGKRPAATTSGRPSAVMRAVAAAQDWVTRTGVGIIGRSSLTRRGLQ
ncbi:hypothetical protein DHEL01_v206723 [Diaporthe helianthi]|uniref:Peptide N-acetyl-beta-D-glucosaminyl asparaginase amidase A N-terminal domain-containing protein n=1 Tax=Diaporthe helianthi TaxID=158607 RepID=A0A2P5HXC2_DIAHE|nr:hypothetical protein DHEL01_v206723 [Diaporthe helianthi]